MKYLAVADFGQTLYIEDSTPAVINALHRGMEIEYYPILVDPETHVPHLGEAVEIDSAPRVPVAHQRITARSSSTDLGSFDVPQ